MSGSLYQRLNAARLPGPCRRRTTRCPISCSGNHARGCIQVIGGVSSKLKKIALLADYLGRLPATDLPTAAVFFSGRPFAQADQRATGLGWATIATAVTRASDAPADAIARAYDRSSDLGQAVAAVLSLRAAQPAGDVAPSLAEVAAVFATLETASGPAAKRALFEALLTRCDPLTAKYVVKVLTGELRIGLREGLLEAAVARAFGRPIDEVKTAGMLIGDIGETAVLAATDRLAEAAPTLFHPLKYMLASPAEDADEIIARLGPTVWVEDKYDGIRAQLHRRGSSARLYSRDLHDVSGQFPEIVRGAADLAWEGILDGEVLAYLDGNVLPFLALQTRLGRKDPSLTLQATVPVIFVAWDALVLNEAGPGSELQPLLMVPLRERRRRLEALQLPLADDGGVFALSHLMTVDSADGLERVFAEARARNNEGLMVKDPDSAYTPGRRGLGWLKMKKALATLDCVVVGVEVGHGKRHGVLSDYTFAVRDEATGGLVNIGKAYSGLTDAEIAEMTRWFESHTIAQFGRYRQVEPTVVVEVAFDVIMRSNRHRSGFALRFPRIVQLRTDKSAAEIDTLETVERLYLGLQQGAEHLVTAGARK